MLDILLKPDYCVNTIRSYKQMKIPVVKKNNIYILIIILSFVTLGCKETLNGNNYASADSAAVWATPGLYRLKLTEMPDTEQPLNLHIYAARGEYQSFQPVIHAIDRNLDIIQFEVSDFIGLNEARIGQSALTLYRQHYVTMERKAIDRGGTNKPEDGLNFFDALIPFIDPATGMTPSGAGKRFSAVPFIVQRGQNQPMWVDILVPRDAAAGDYTATYTFTLRGGDTVTGTVTITVWDFELPLVPSLKSAFLPFWSGRGNRWIAEELLRARVMPYVTDWLVSPSPVLSSIFSKEVQAEWAEKYGFFMSGLGFLWNYGTHNTMPDPPSAEEIQARIDRHIEGLFLYNYTADEIGGPQFYHAYPQIKKWSQAFHSKNISQLIVMPLHEDLFDNGLGRSAVDIWVMHPTQFDGNYDRVRERIQAGNEVWSYTALDYDNFSPKWVLDFSPINFRIMQGFINQNIGATGFLYWAVDYFKDTNPWNLIESLDGFVPSQGFLLYPGDDAGIAGMAPSVRLKWIRDGVQDYEYIEILKNLKGVDAALAITRMVGEDFRNWTQDATVLEATRKEIAQLIIDKQ
jgi:hypothetical protein